MLIRIATSTRNLALLILQAESCSTRSKLSLLEMSDLFSKGAGRFYSTHNRSVKLMAGSSLYTYGYFIEPVSGHSYMSIILIRNFLHFMSRISSSRKDLHSICKSDVMCDM